MQHTDGNPQPDPTLVRAVGGALSIFATLLSRRGMVDMHKIANLLGIYAVATSETDETKGSILGCWAGMLRNVAEHKDVQSHHGPPA